MCQLNLANKIPKLLLPTSKPEEKLTETDIEFDNFSQSQADLGDHDLGLTFQKVKAQQVLVQDLGEDPDHDVMCGYTPLTIRETETLMSNGLYI